MNCTALSLLPCIVCCKGTHDLACTVLQTLAELDAVFGDEHLVRLYRLAQQYERSTEAYFDMTSPASCNEDDGGTASVNGQSNAR